MYNAKVLADSISPDGVRLTTMEWTFPRFILAEVNTHRSKSSNAASSRAIPIKKRVDAVLTEPFVPSFAKNQAGMQAGEVFTEEDQKEATTVWLQARDAAVLGANNLSEKEAHKQYVNRLIEPFSWCTLIITATDWSNLFWLRCDSMAQPEFQTIAFMALKAYLESVPKEIGFGGWHRPLIFQEDEEEVANYVAEMKGKYPLLVDSYEEAINERLNKISAARCARVSYLTHSNIRDHERDLELYGRLVGNTTKHSSPLEHVATPALPEDMVYRINQLTATPTVHGKPHISPKPGEIGYCGNFKGWKQLRKFLPGENQTDMKAVIDKICDQQITDMLYNQKKV